MSGENADKWKEASDAEYKSLMENGTWELVELPVGQKPIMSKWIFKVKYAGDGKMERFKARLVARGFTQQYSINYISEGSVSHINCVLKFQLICS